MLKEFSVKTLSVILSMCIASAALTIPVGAVSNGNTSVESDEKLTGSSVEQFEEAGDRADYMSKEQYSQLGFSSLTDPDAFDENDTSNPLEGYEPSILSEIYIGEGNHDGGDKAKAYIAENAKDYDNLDIYKLKDNHLSYSDSYYNQKGTNDGRWQYQSSITKSIKLGDLSSSNYIKDSIIQFSIFLDRDNGEKSTAGILLYEYDEKQSGENKLSKQFQYTTVLENGKFVQDVELQESGGYMAITVGDFDHDNYNEIAAYFSYKNNPKIAIFKQQENKQTGKVELKWTYTIDLKSIASYFDMCKDTNRPLVNLSTTNISGQDDLVISVSMPYSNDKDFYQNGCTAIYSWENNKPVRKYLDSGIRTNENKRMKFTSSATMDIFGNGKEVLVIAANENNNYNLKSSRGDMRSNKNLLNIVLWEDGKYVNAWQEPIEIDALDWIKKDKDRKEPIAITGTRFNSGSEKDTLFVEGVFYQFIPGTGETSNECIKNGKFIVEEKFNGKTGDNNAFIHIAESASFVESDRLAEQALVVLGDEYGADKDKIYLDIYWCFSDSNKIGYRCVNNDYFHRANEDDYGTFFTLCPIDVDNDTTYMKYKGKTVGWSNPSIHSVMLSAPYWSELDYGTAMAARGSTSYSISTSSSNSTTGSWNVGLGLSFGFEFGAKEGLGFFQETEYLFGLNFDLGLQYAGSYQTSHTTSETLTFTSGGGDDYVALLAVPIVVYHYDQWLPEHKATEEEVEEYKENYGEEGCPRVGDIIEGEFKDMDVSVQLNPTNSCIPVSDYNKVIEEFNRTAEDEEKLPVIDLDSLYAGRAAGDPTTYASNAAAISSLDIDDSETRVSNNGAAVGVNGKSTTAIAMGEGSGSSLSNGFSASLKVTSSLAMRGKGGCMVYAIGSFKLMGSSSFGGGCTWASSNSDNITYTTTFASLPESAKTGTTPAGTGSSDYEFTAKAVKWNPNGLGGASIETVEGDDLKNAACVIGCTVEMPNGAPPSLPTDLHVSSTTSNTATLKWTNKTNGDRLPKSYKLYYSTSSNGTYVPLQLDGKDVIISGDSDTYTVNKLKENTTYYFKLKAYHYADASGISSVLGPYASGKTKNSTGTEPKITKPPLDLYRAVGNSAVFTIQAEPSRPENSLSYQWQKLTIGDYLADWKDIEGDAGKSNSFNAAYFAENGIINEANAKSLDKTVYRCIVIEQVKGNRDYYTVISRAATLNVVPQNHQHEYTEDGFCRFCDSYEPAVLNNNVYEIGNAGQLFWFAAFVNGDKNYTDAPNSNINAILTKDIDLENRSWKAINDFKGTFDGQNHSISNINMSCDETSGYSEDCRGLFASSSGTIKNFKIYGKISIEAVANGFTDSIGGVVGKLSSGKVSNIISYVDISSGNVDVRHIGGIAGNVEGNSVVERCMYFGKINLPTARDCIGGIVGYIKENVQIINCANLGDITASNTDAAVGGILGYVNAKGTSLKNCYNYGTVKNGNNVNCGAIIGEPKSYNSANITNNYYLKDSALKAFGKGDLTANERTKDLFKSGEVAHHLNNGVTDGTQIWYQNIDNGKEPNLYPVMDNTCGTVYSPYDDYYSNFDTVPDEFDRDEDGRFIIRTYDDLVKLADLVENEYNPYGTASYVLQNNIIAPKDSEWTKGIGSASNGKGFNGEFYGNGYIIFGLNINNSQYGALFEKVGENGVVKELCITASTYKTDSEYAGGIAAINDGLIDHCIGGVALTSGFIYDDSKQPIKLSDYNSSVNGVISGGIAALNNGSIKGCRNASFVIGTEICGGIAGINSESGSIYGCAGNTDIGDKGSKIKGGLVGKNLGSIASSYTSARVIDESDRNAGSVAGVNNSQNVKNVFYTTVNGLKAIGSDSEVMLDDTNKKKSRSEMTTQGFADELTSVTDDSIQWICNENTKINNNYPTIKCDFNKSISKTTENGIVVKGNMHSGLQVSCKNFDKNSEIYKKLLTYAGDKKIVATYNLITTDSNGMYIPSGLWCMPVVEISVPVKSSQRLSVVGITADGEIKEHEVVSVKDNMLTFVADEIVSFALLADDDTSVKPDNDADDKPTDNTDNKPTNNTDNNSSNNSSVNTGDVNSSFIYIVLIAAAAVLFIASSRRKKFE